MTTASTLYRTPFLSSSDLGNVTSETQFLNARGALAVLPLPSNGTLDHKRFRLVIDGRVETIINTTFTLNAYFGLSTTIASNTQIFTTNAVTINNVNTNFNIRIDLFWDSTSNTINGNGQGQVNNNPVGPAGLVNVVTNANPARDNSTFLVSGATYGFSLTGLFGNSSTGNHAFIDGFDLDMA